jgi:hypothetical protein
VESVVKAAMAACVLVLSAYATDSGRSLVLAISSDPPSIAPSSSLPLELGTPQKGLSGLSVHESCSGCVVGNPEMCTGSLGGGRRLARKRASSDPTVRSRHHNISTGKAAWLRSTVAVGTTITDRPPHRSVRCPRSCLEQKCAQKNARRRCHTPDAAMVLPAWPVCRTS